MGSDTSATTNQKISTTTISQADIDTLNTYLTNIATNIVVNNTSTCGIDVSAANNNTVSGVKTDTLIMPVTQDIDVTVIPKCVNVQTASSTISQSFINTILQEITSDFSPSILSEMAGTTTAQSDSDSTGTSTSSVDQTNDTITADSIREKISNIIETNVANNFTTNTLSSCLTNVSLANTNSLTDSEFSYVYMPVSQSINSTVTSECSALQESVSDITTSIAQELGLTISDTSSPVITTTEEATLVSVSAGSDSAASDSSSGGGDDDNDDDDGLGTSVIVGIIVGAIVCIALIIGIIYLVKYMGNKLI